MQDRDLRTGPRREMRELERDVPSADENDPVRQPVELQEVIAGGKVLGSIDRQLHRFGAAGDDDAPRLENVVTDANAMRAYEVCRPVVTVDALLAIALFSSLGHRVREGTFERQIGRAQV